MNVEKDDLELRLELQLGDEFRGQLDQQLGRAAAHFLEQGATRVDRRITWRWRRGATIGLAALAAACCAALIVWHRNFPGPLLVHSEKAPTLSAAPRDAPRDPVTGPSVPSDNEHQPPPPLSSNSDTEQREIEQVVETKLDSDRQPLVLARALSARTLDEGTLLVGRTPVRKVRRQWLERVEWFDAENGARVQRIVPREEVVFVPLPIN